MTLLSAVGRSVTPFLMAALAAACTSSASAVGSACVSAGGTCRLGSSAPTCEQAPTAAQDCDPPPENPGGGLCCLEHVDSGTSIDASRVTDAAHAKDAAEASTGPLPVCTWDRSLFHTDGSANLCFAARTLTVCTGADGCTDECLVDDASQCPGSSSEGSGSCSASSGGASPHSAEAGSTECADTCKPDEFAVECENSGFGGQGPPGQPPSSCRANTSAPGASMGAYYCCPCGD